jgi:serine/threonine-protein kinase RsbW
LAAVIVGLVAGQVLATLDAQRVANVPVHASGWVCSMQRKFSRSFDSLECIFEFAELYFEKAGIDRSARYPVHLVMEELFTNMVKYNPDNAEEILLSIAGSPTGIEVSLTDYDVDEFDVTADRQVDTAASLRDREVGGLGLHLVQKMVDTLDYTYANRQSTITFTKGIAGADV